MRQTLVKKHLLRIAALACITGFLSLSGTMAFAADSTPAGHTLADRHVARGMKCTACHVDAKGGALKAANTDYGVCATCHGDYNAMIKKTDAKYKNSGQPNPHAQHDGALPAQNAIKDIRPALIIVPNVTALYTRFRNLFPESACLTQMGKLSPHTCAPGWFWVFSKPLKKKIPACFMLVFSYGSIPDLLKFQSADTSSLPYGAPSWRRADGGHGGIPYVRQGHDSASWKANKRDPQRPDRSQADR